MDMSFADQFFDLKTLSSYSCLGVSTLREYIESNGLPCFKLKGKVLVKRSEFDAWIENYRLSGERLDTMADEIMNNLKTGKSDK